MRGSEWLLDLADVAEAQWGLFTTAQATAVGVTPQQLKRMADKWLVVRLRHGVYRLAGAPAEPQELIRAEWLALEPKRTAGERVQDPIPAGIVSHRSAARLLELGDLDADIHEFTVPRRRGTRSHDVTFHIASLDRDDWRLVDGLPVTRPLRTSVDLAAARLDGGHLASVVRDAVLTGDASLDEFAARLSRFAHRYGMKPGAGGEFVDHLIEEAGIPESASVVVEAPIARALAEVAAPKIIAGQVDANAHNAFLNRPYLDNLFSQATERLVANAMPSLSTAVAKSLEEQFPRHYGDLATVFDGRYAFAQPELHMARALEGFEPPDLTKMVAQVNQQQLADLLPDITKMLTRIYQQQLADLLPDITKMVAQVNQQQLADLLPDITKMMAQIYEQQPDAFPTAALWAAFEMSTPDTVAAAAKVFQAMTPAEMASPSNESTDDPGESPGPASPGEEDGRSAGEHE